VAIGRVTTGWLHIHDPKARFRTDLRILKGDVPSCAPGRILGHERVGVTLHLRSGRVLAAVSGTSKRPARIIPNVSYVSLGFGTGSGAACGRLAFKLVVSFDSL
jgi:hypothetical protein